MKNKKIYMSVFCFLLGMLLTACVGGEEGSKLEQNNVTENEIDESVEDSSLKKIRETCIEKNAMGAILFLGYMEEEPLSEAYFTNLEEQGYLSAYPFLSDITKEKVFKTEGNEIYCIVPADLETSVSVNEWILEESNDFAGTKGDLLYRSNTGEPFIICCNVSDILSNISISMMDSTGRAFSDYNPCISLKDGSVVLPMEESNPLLLDFSLFQPIDEETEDVKNVDLYFRNENADGFIIQTYEIEQLNENMLLDLMIANEIFPNNVQILSFNQEGTKIQIDLNEAFAEYVNTMGTTGEYLAIGSLVNTFLSAFDGETINLTVEGKPLETGHNIYDFEMTFYE